MSSEGSTRAKENVAESVAKSTQDAFFIVAIIFIASISALAIVYFCFPELEEHEKQHIKLALDVEGAKNLGQVLERYKDRFFVEVLAAIVVVYIFLQTFAIPGSISLSILSGFLYPFPMALALVCFCSATGASLCYLISSQLGRRLVFRFWPERAAIWAAKVQQHKANFLSYMIFLRVTPLVPNWFINICAPVIGVPLKPFFLGTFIGVAPPSFLAIQGGQALQQISEEGAKLSWLSVTLLVVCSCISLAPVIFKNRLRAKFD